MNYIKKNILFLVLFGSATFTANAQQDFPQAFRTTLEAMDIDIAIPVERSYRNKRVRRNVFFQYDYAIRSKRKKVEIQYALTPSDQLSSFIPSIYTTTITTSIASNLEHRATIAVHEIETTELSEVFNADWGRITYFQPKRSFSKYQYGKLLSLYKSGKGMISILFLFNAGQEEEVERLSLPAKFE